MTMCAITPILLSTVTGLVALVAATTAFFAARALRDEPVPAALHFEVTRPQTTYAQIAFSPDGRQLAIAPTFDGKGSLWLRRLDSVQPTLLRGTAGATFPFWSPDGKSIGFFADRKLKRLDLEVLSNEQTERTRRRKNVAVSVSSSRELNAGDGWPPVAAKIARRVPTLGR